MKNNFIKIFLLMVFGGLLISATINLDELFNYANQDIPDYINKDNTGDNPIRDETATLGRVLFYDKNLSSNQTISCASCHLQAHAFGDPRIQSEGVNGLTGRHSMRLINARFSFEDSFFWDERAETLEDQTILPIKDHIEMGFSGVDGAPTIGDLIDYLKTLDYYNRLFQFAYGDSEITEIRIQRALAQFIRSIQSFDSRFDEGLVQVANISVPFPNFTPSENRGKHLFINTPFEGVGCADCHIPPEFSLAFNSQNNGVITVAGMLGEIDITNVRAPSLRDLVKPNGEFNGPFMHDGSFSSLLEVINHYNAIPDNPENTNLDVRLKDNNGNPQQLNLTEEQKLDLVAFLKTLSGTDVYTNEKWSNPFNKDGSITIIGGNLGISEKDLLPTILISPNPASDFVTVETTMEDFNLSIYSNAGRKLIEKDASFNEVINLTSFSAGLYFIRIQSKDREAIVKRLILK